MYSLIVTAKMNGRKPGWPSSSHASPLIPPILGMSEEPIRPVRVCVTYRALADIDPEQVRDLDGALTTFDTNRDRIDMAANSKFDAGEVDLHEGQPLTLLTTDDL